jgi:hypothetical protein
MKQMKPIIAESVLSELIELYERQGTDKAKEWVKKLRFVRLHLAKLSLENNEQYENIIYLESLITPLEAGYKTMKRKYERTEKDLATLKENINHE